MKLNLQARVKHESAYRLTNRNEAWDPAKTALIVVDMWDLHSCKNAARRVSEMAPRMNQLIEKARSEGVFIIHAPSDCMKAYEGQAARERAKRAPVAPHVPADIDDWYSKGPDEEGSEYPIDRSLSHHCDDDPAEHKAWVAELRSKKRFPGAPWARQIETLKIRDQDAITDSGREIWNLLEERGITNLIFVGVHANICVVNRPFGLRKMSQHGKRVVLTRDLTDSMYNPARWPFVDHARGTALYIEFLEKFVTPTITSDQITGGSPFSFGPLSSR